MAVAQTEEQKKKKPVGLRKPPEQPKSYLAPLGDKITGGYAGKTGRALGAAAFEASKLLRDPSKVAPISGSNVVSAFQQPTPSLAPSEPVAPSLRAPAPAAPVAPAPVPTAIEAMKTRTAGGDTLYGDPGSFNQISLRGAGGTDTQGRGSFTSTAGPGKGGMSDEQWGAMSNADRIKANVAAYENQTASLRSLREAQQGGDAVSSGPFTLSRTKPGESFYKKPIERPDFNEGLEGVSKGRAAKIATQREENWMRDQQATAGLRQRATEGELDRQSALDVAGLRGKGDGAPSLRDQIALKNLQRGMTKDVTSEQRAQRQERDDLFAKRNSENPGDRATATQALASDMEKDPAGETAERTMDVLTQMIGQKENAEFNSVWDGFLAGRTQRGNQGRLNLDDLADFELENPGWFERNILGDTATQIRTHEGGVAMDVTGSADDQLLLRAIQIAKQRAK